MSNLCYENKRLGTVRYGANVLNTLDLVLAYISKQNIVPDTTELRTQILEEMKKAP